MHLDIPLYSDAVPVLSSGEYAAIGSGAAVVCILLLLIASLIGMSMQCQ
jgi:hypothetical protein